MHFSKSPGDVFALLHVRGQVSRHSIVLCLTRLLFHCHFLQPPVSRVDHGRGFMHMLLMLALRFFGARIQVLFGLLGRFLSFLQLDVGLDFSSSPGVLRLLGLYRQLGHLLLHLLVSPGQLFVFLLQVDDCLPRDLLELLPIVLERGLLLDLVWRASLHRSRPCSRQLALQFAELCGHFCQLGIGLSLCQLQGPLHCHRSLLPGISDAHFQLVLVLSLRFSQLLFDRRVLPHRLLQQLLRFILLAHALLQLQRHI